VLEFWAAIF
jgi:hypothetical protein